VPSRADVFDWEGVSSPGHAMQVSLATLCYPASSAVIQHCPALSSNPEHVESNSNTKP